MAVPPHSLEPGAVYDIVARIWNNSTEAPVVGLSVDFSYLSFGIGVQAHPRLGATQPQVEASFQGNLVAQQPDIKANNLDWAGYSARQAVGQATDPLTIANQDKPENTWTIHPVIDGCQPEDPNRPPVIR